MQNGKQRGNQPGAQARAQGSPHHAPTLAALLRQQARKQPDAPALLAPGRDALSYAELLAQTQRLGRHLRALGALPTTRVAVVLPNGPEMAVAFLGVAASAACAPLNPGYQAAEFRFHLQDTRAEMLVVLRGAAGAAAEVARELGLTLVEIEVDAAAPAGCFKLSGLSGDRLQPAANIETHAPDAVALLLHTSGTTARPKLVPLSQANLMASAHHIATHLGLSPQDRCLNVMPLFHIHGLVGALLATLAGGGSMVCAPGFDDRRFVDGVAAFNPSWYTAVPTIHQAVLAQGAVYRQKASAHRFRFVRSSSAALPASTMRQLQALLQAPVVEAYGMTEASHQMASNAVHAGEQTPGSVGVAAGVQIAILDAAGRPLGAGQAGEIAVRGPGVTSGYENNLEANAEAFHQGWFRTGDLGHVDERGQLFIAGRLKEIVNRGGEKISPREVDDALLEHSAVAQAAAFGVPHPSLGEDLAAAVVLRAGATTAEAELREFLFARLSDFKVPSQIVFVHTIPAGATGKVQRTALHKQLSASLTRAFVAPGTAEERTVEQIFREVLECGPVGVHDNFFAKGGDSLRGARVIARVNGQFGLNLPVIGLFQHPSIAELAAAIAVATSSATPSPRDPSTATTEPIALRQHTGPSACSFSQEALWIVERLVGRAGVYNSVHAVRIRAGLDAAVLDKALQALLQRHEVLRTSVEEHDGALVQVVHENVAAPLRLIDAPELGRTGDETALYKRLVDDAQTSFDLAQAPLLRASLWRLAKCNGQHADSACRCPAEGDHMLLLVAHHIVADGWSMQIIARELGVLYSAFSKGLASPLPPLPVQFADWALWQRGSQKSERMSRSLHYWKEHLAGLTPLEYPTDFPRPPQLNYAGRTERFGVPAELANKLRNLALENNATLFMVLLAVFSVLLKRCTHQDDVAVGSPMAGRERPELEGVVGFFVNSVVLRTDFSGSPSFTELLERVRRTALQAYMHQDLPFEKVVAELSPQRDLSRNPLYQVSFALNNQPAPVYTFSNASSQLMQLEIETAKFDLSLTFVEDSGGLAGVIEYSAELYRRDTVQRMVLHLQNLLAGVVANPGMRVTHLPMLGAVERRQLLVEWNATSHPYPHHIPVHTLVEHQAERTPDAVAVVFEGQSLSYRELNSRANALAHHLRTRGIGPEQTVGLCLERSFHLPTALLAVLKAGGAFLPLDPELPEERLAFMLADTAAPVVLTQSHILPRLMERRAEQKATISRELDPRPLSRATDSVHPELICLDTWQPAAGADKHNPGIDVAPSSLAYVIYTSGSTGKPKGVMSLHQGLSNHVQWLVPAMAMTAADRVLQKTAISFDASIWEFFAPWLAGAKLVMAAPGLQRDLAALVNLLRHERITIVQFVPSALRVVLDEPAVTECRALRYVSSGGEALTTDLALAFQDRLPWVTLSNFYGPSEASDHTTHAPATLGVVGAVTVPIGKPIANVECYVLDEHLQPVPVGVMGELLIGGIGLARGYLNRPELTAERFIAHPFSEGERLYRTGDLVRWRADGNIEYLGRNDFQVKIRGVRVELGEIEAVLRNQAGVREALVMAHKDHQGHQRLVAYVVGEGASGSAGTVPDAAAIASGLAQRLSAYMLPSAVVVLSELPTLPNGKVDRKALPTPDQPSTRREAVAPSTPIEQAIRQIWHEVLGIEHIDAHDNFFELGGHSLQAMQVMSRLRTVLQAVVPLRTLFDAPTVAALALAVMQQRGGGAADAQGSIPRLSTEQRQGPLRLSAAQQRMGILQALSPNPALYNVSVVLDLHGPLDLPSVQRSLQLLAQQHEVLRARWVTAEGAQHQRVDPMAAWPLEHVMLAGAEPDVIRQDCEAKVAQHVSLGFDLSAAPAIRALLLTLDAGHHRMVWTLHHSLCDGRSVEVLQEEWCALYSALSQGRTVQLTEPALQYADYAAWEPQALADGVRDIELTYWHRQLAGAPLSLDLPTDHARPAVARFNGTIVELVFSAEQLVALQALAHRSDTTLFMVVLALWQTLLHRHSGQSTVVTGSVSANRPRSELDDMVGCFANTLALRADFHPQLTVAGLLRQVRSTALDAYEHARLPFDEVVAALKLPRDGNRMPLLQTFVVMHPPATSVGAAGALRTERVALASRVAKFDLSLDLQQVDGTLQGAIEYDTDLFERSSIERMAAHLHVLLNAMCADTDSPVAVLPMLTAAEREQMLVSWNATAQPIAHHIAVHTLVEQQAGRTPDDMAVVFEGHCLSYGELNARANALARHLRQQGIGPERLVGLCLERSLHLPVALLAVLKTGGAFVPLDPELPTERLAYMLGDTSAPVVLTQSHLLARLAIAARGRSPDRDGTAPEPIDPKIICLDTWQPSRDAGVDNLSIDIAPTSLAYVIYTSGSTGQPKGVMALHQGLSNHIQWLVPMLRVTPGDRVLQKTTISFDASIWEFFAPWLAGATLVLAPPSAHRDPAALAQTLLEENITVTQFVPAALRAMIDEPALAQCTSLRYVVCGGEALSTDLARAFKAKLGWVMLGNFYGPSEASDDSTHALPEIDLGDASTVAIGRPIANVQCYVLDAHLQPVPVRAVAELFVGGVGLARGYLNRDDLTAERFIAHPFVAGERLYRTGDLVRYRADGNIEYVGRNDFQVKVRGMRVELGEIEAAILAQPGVRETVVVAREDAPGLQRLVAYVVGNRAGSEPDAAALARALAQRLPEHMLPSSWVVLDSLPTLSNGKIDRNALPAPSEHADAAAPVMPRTPVEQTLWEIWRDVLRVENFGVHENFFALGGNSLVVAQVGSRLRSTLQVKLPLRALFDAPTIAGLALGVARAGRVQTDESIPIMPPDMNALLQGHPLSPAQLGMWLADRLDGSSPAYNMPFTERLRGPLDSHALQLSLNDLVHRHDSLRIQIYAVDGAPRQRLTEAATLHFDTLRFEMLGDSETRARLSCLLQAHAAAPFDLQQAPLARALLVRLQDDEHVLQLVVHHIISDGWSNDVLRRDLAAFYRIHRARRAAPVDKAVPPNEPPVPRHAGPGFLDYAHWLAGRTAAGQLEPHARYWQQRLKDVRPLALPVSTGHRLTDAETAAGTDPIISRSVGKRVVADLGAIGRRGNASLFMVYLAAFKLLLMRWCGQQDVAVGTPMAQRDLPELADIVGPLLNTLVLRTDLSGDPLFMALLERVRSTVLEALLHQEQSFHGLVAALNPERIDGRQPFFDVMVNALPEAQADMALEGLSAEPVTIASGAAKFAMTLYIEPQSPGAAFRLHYRSAMFAHDTVDALMDQYVHLLEQIAARPEARIHEYSLITDSARAVLPDPAQPLRPVEPRLIFERFLKQAHATPNAAALAWGDDAMTYAQLEQVSRGLALRLRGQGVLAGNRVVICADRGMALVVAILAASRAGAVFCVLDNGYPAARNSACLRQLEPVVVLDCSNLDSLASFASDVGKASPEMDARDGSMATLARRKLPADSASLLREFAVESETLPLVDASAAAYVSFTSGTTGDPKGIVTRHAPLPHFVEWHVRQHQLGAGDRFSMLSGLAHDPLLRDIFTPLSIGATLCIPPATHSQASCAWAPWLADSRITVVHLTPSIGQLVATDGTAGTTGVHLPELRWLFWGGESLTSHTVAALRAVAPHAQHVNFYGTTETPQAMAHFKVPTDANAIILPIGQGIDDAQLLLMTDDGAQAAPGQPGEIWIRTRYLCSGYLADDTLTESQFVRNPFGTAIDDRCYRTGDRGSYQSDGSLLCLGRVDAQLKVNGLRVEPAEIESVAQSVRGVDRAVLKAIVVDAKPPWLVLYYTCFTEIEVESKAVEDYLRVCLPSAMWPRSVVRVNAFALLPNGKIDLRALPDTNVASQNLAPVSAAPCTAAEKAIAEIWQRLLGVAHVEPHENFFDLGGQSLLAVQAAYAIEQRLGFTLGLRRLMHETLAQLAATPVERVAADSPAEPARATWLGRILSGVADSMGFGKQ